MCSEMLICAVTDRFVGVSVKDKYRTAGPIKPMSVYSTVGAESFVQLGRT